MHFTQNQIFELMVTRFPKPPTLIIYDNACNLLTYCLNREPEFFKDTKFAVDAFHYAHHTNCNMTFNSILLSNVDPKIKSSLAEQKNLRISILTSNFPKMHPRNAFLILWYLVSRLNRYESNYFVTFGLKDSKLDILRRRIDQVGINEIEGEAEDLICDESLNAEDSLGVDPYALDSEDDETSITSFSRSN